MAIDKMVDSAKLDREMLATANAIREKGKTEAAIPWEDEIGYEQAVLAIKGGVELNFEVVGGDTRPANPSENTIWVKTLNEITGWGFGTEADMPESSDVGMVWFATAENSSFKFDALKKDSIIVAPIKAYQYISKTQASAVNAEIYQDGIWKPWIVYLYNSGEESIDKTGGWEIYNAQNGKWSKEIDKIVASYTSSAYTQGCVHTINTVDVRGFSSLCAEVEHTSGECLMGLSNRTDYLYCYDTSFYSAYDKFSSSGVHRCHLSNTQTDTFRVVIGGAWIGKIKKIWLE